MISHRVLIVLAMISLALYASSGDLFASDAVPTYITAAINKPGRAPAHIARDGLLKTDQVLTFAGVKPGQVVADLMPGGGYYTLLLSGLVGPKGHVYAVVPNTGRNVGPLVKDASQDKPLSRIERARVIEEWPQFKSNIDVYWEGLEARGGMFAVPKQLDFVIMANAYHALKGPEFDRLDMAALDKAIFHAMKNGATVLVIDNSANKETDFSSAAKLNRVDPDAVKAEMLAAGFVFDAESKILANAQDDHTNAAANVLDDRTASPADMFVLRFKKPMNAANTDQRPPIGNIAALFGNTLISNPGAIEVGNGPREHRHFLHADGTYQEFGKSDSRNNVFAAGTWFFDADGWNCRRHLYQLEAWDMTDCAGAPGAYEHKVGDKWSEPRGSYELLKGYAYFNQ